MTPKRLPNERHALVVKYVPLVHRLAQRFRSSGCSYEELIAAGTEGLIRAAIDFDETRGATFVTYARWWIRSALQDHVYKNVSAVRRARPRPERGRFATYIQRDEPFNEDLRDGASDPYAEVEARQEAARVYRAFAALNERERYVTWVLAHDAPIMLLATELNLSRERVRQIHQRALQKLREALRQQERGEKQTARSSHSSPFVEASSRTKG